jgi:tetratricopeptide (TPR) repeat protein
MLAKEPRDRPPSARATVAMLTAIESGLEPAPDPIRPAVSTDERRLASVVAVAPSVPVGSPNDATVEVASAANAGTGPIASAAEKHRGDLVLLPGRGAVIVFVADSPVEAALSAARAALEIVKADATHRVGVSAGQASLRTGPEPGLLERAMELAAEPGKVRIDDAARSLVGGGLDVEMTAAGPIVRGERRVEQTASRAIVGRDREVQTLFGALEGAIAARVAQLVIVTGPPGLGKSRILRELYERARTHASGPAILDARAEELRRHTPFAALGALVRRGFGISESAQPAEQRRTLAAAVGASASPDDARRITDFLGIAAGLQPEEGSVEIAAALRDPQLMDDQIERATLDALSALSQRAGGLVVLLDDAHWADVATLKLLARALRRLVDRPLFVAAFARPELDESAPHALREAASQRIQLGGLPRRAAERLVLDAIGDRASAATIERIVVHGDGNPLFLQELCAAHLEGRASAEVPPNVLASVEARLLRLEPPARKIMRAASVFGEAFWQGGLAALLGDDEIESRRLGDWLVHLVDRGLFVPRRATRFAGQPELVFRHPLLREAAYAMLTPEDRTEGHKRAAAWLGAIGERDPAVLAEHSRAAGDAAEAARRFAEAAQLCFVRNDLVRTVAHAESAFASGLDGADRGRLLVILCEAHFWLGELDRGVERGREAVALLAPETQPWMDALSALVRCLARTGDPAAIETARELVRAARADPSLVPTPSALPHIVSTALRAGLHQLVNDVLDVLGRSALSRAEDPLARAHVLTCRSWQAMFDGDYAACVSYDTEVLRCTLEAGDIRQACLARVHVGYDFMILGAYDRAAQELTAAQEEAGRRGLEQVEELAKHNLSLAVHRLGESDRALEMQRECLAHALERRNQLETSHARHYLAIIHFERGELDASAAELERVLEGSPSSALRWEALGRLAAISLRRGRADLARAQIDEALEGIEQLRNAEEGDGFVRLVAVQVQRALGEEQRATEILLAARNRLLWRAGRIADPTLRRTFMRAVPEHALTLELAEQLASAGRTR